VIINFGEVPRRNSPFQEDSKQVRREIGLCFVSDLKVEVKLCSET
jgi:hypothetical protein